MSFLRLTSSTPKLLLLSLLSFGLCSELPAQYVGSDNFDDNSIGAEWDFSYNFTGTDGVYTNTNGRLEFTATGTADESKTLVWNNAANASYTENWTASLLVSNLSAPSVTNASTIIGLQIYSANAQYGFFNIDLYRSATGSTGVLFEKGRSGDGTVDNMVFKSYLASQADLDAVLLTAAFNAATKGITLSYSLDNGATTAFSTTFNPITGDATSWNTVQGDGAWFAAPTDGFSFRILSRSNLTAVGPGVMYADNFSVSAVPEPSTYAAIAGGLMLGFAVWKRRKARQV